MLNLTADQKKQLEAFQKDASARLDKLLTDEQKKQLKDTQPGFGAGGSGSPPQPGQILSPSQQASLKLMPEAKKQLQDLQKEADAKLDKLLTADQKKQFKDMRAGPGRGGPGGFGPGGPGGFAPGGGSALFRAYRYAPDYAGLVGKDLKPGKTVEEVQPKQAKGK
jgi:Spy/CpxP family protein refolding chaperone